MQQSATGADSAQRTAYLEAEVARLTRIIELKDEHIRLLNLRLFGPKSEKLSSGQMSLLLGEASLTAGEVDQEAARPEAQKHRTRCPAPSNPAPTIPGASACPSTWSAARRSFPAARRIATVPSAEPNDRSSATSGVKSWAANRPSSLCE